MIEQKDLELAATQIADSVEFYKKIVKNKRTHDSDESMWQKFIKAQNANAAFWERKK